MHICYIYPGFPPEKHAGGIGTYIDETIKSLKNSSYRISIISRSDKFCDETVNLSKNITLYRVGESKLNKSFRSGGHLEMYRRILKMVDEINIKNPISIIESCDWGGEGSILLNKYRDILVVRCHTPSFVSEKYNPSSDEYLSLEIKNKEKELLNKAKYIVSPSNSLIKEIRKSVSIKGKISIEPYSIERINILVKETYNISNIFKIIIVGRIEERKGQDIAIKAVNKLIKRNINVRFDIVGADSISKDGDLCSVKFFKGVYGVAKGSIRLLGEFDRSEVLQMYSKYDLSLAPSRFDNFPFSVLEAMGAGLPVIGNNSSGIKEQISSYKDGVLFNGDVDDLVEKIILLYENKKFREEIGKGALESIKLKYSPEIVMENMIFNYRNIINNKQLYGKL